MKKRLISLMLAGTLATAGLTACSTNECTLASDIPERKELTLQMSLEINQMLTNVVSFEVEMVGDQYFIKFLAHFDKGLERTTRMYPSYYKYIDHKDYIVTYEISEAEYIDFMQFCSPAKTVKLENLSLDTIPTLQSIIDNYDPISIDEESTNKETRGKVHSY